jgi:hypothetical protein
MDISKDIGAYTRHHARWKRMAEFARDARKREIYEERARFWLEVQSTMASILGGESASKPRSKI